LAKHLHITLHPDKTTIQHYSKGTKFVGAVIKPGRVYVSNRTRGSFIKKMMKYNREATTVKERLALLERVRGTINSYLGLMCHYNSYKVRRKIAEKYVLPTWGKYLYFENEFRICKVKIAYDQRRRLRCGLRHAAFARAYLAPK
jgi:hypothetical protein